VWEPRLSMCIRASLALGFALVCSTLASAAPARPASEAKMSGYGEKPRPGDSRYPGDQPRPAGALLSRLPAGLTLGSESLAVRCRFRGGGCLVRHAFTLENRGAARRVLLHVVTATLTLSVEVQGHRAPLTDPPTPISEGPARTWQSSGQGVKPGSTRAFQIPGRTRRRPVRHRYVWVEFPAGGRRTVTLITQSVGGFDRTSRPRTQAEVAFALNRRQDNFTYHHEIRLRDRAARARPGGAAGRIPLEIDVPRSLVVGADVALRCETHGKRRRCRGVVPGDRSEVRWAVAAKYHLPLGVFVTVGAAFTRHRRELWLRAGLSVLLRQRKDLLTLSGETDAHTRFGLALVYQLFLPYTPRAMEMGAHGELGLVLDVWPEVRPAIRLGAAFHMSILRLNVFADIYPGEFKDGGAPAWRIGLGAGIGL